MASHLTRPALSRQSHTAHSRRPSRVRLNFEKLEDRTVPAGFIVPGTFLEMGVNNDGSLISGGAAPDRGILFGGVEFLKGGVLQEGFTVNAGGTNFTNNAAGGISQIPFNIGPFNNGPVHGAGGGGTVAGLFTMRRSMAFTNAGWSSVGGIIRFNVSITNLSPVAMQFAYSEVMDPDQVTTSTFNDVVLGGDLVRGTAANGLTIGWGSSDSRAVMSVEAFNSFNPFLTIDSPNDPNGTSSDQILTIALNFGMVQPGENVRFSFLMVVATTAANAESLYTQQVDFAGAFSGKVFNDVDADGLQTGSEPALPGWVVYADINNNGVRDNNGGFGADSVEPDFHADGANLSAPSANVTLSVANGSNGIDPGNTVRSKFSALASSGTSVFAADANDDWVFSRRLRMDFSSPVMGVRIDMIGNDASDTGFLEIFNSSNASLGIVASPVLASGQVAILTATSTTANIAYAIAYGNPATGDTVVLDNLRFWRSEPFATTAATGTYSIAVEAGPYIVREELQPGWRRVLPFGQDFRSISVPPFPDVTGVDFSNRAVPLVDLNGPAPGVNTTGSYTEDTPPQLIGNAAATVSTLNVPPRITSATVRITNLLNAGQELLSADPGATGITVSYNPATGVLTLTGNASSTASQFQTVLQTVKYQNLSQAPNPTPRVIEFIVSDGFDSSTPATSTVTVVPVPDPPGIDLNGGAPGTGSTATYTEGDFPTIITTSALTIFDVDGPIGITSATVKISNLLDAGREFLNANPGATGIVVAYDPGTGVLTLTGSVTNTPADFEQVLETVTYQNTDMRPNLTLRLIEFRGIDGTLIGDPAICTVTIIPVNNPPVPSAGGPYTVAEGRTVQVNSVGSIDPDDAIVLYEWDLDNNGSFETPGLAPLFNAFGLDGPTSRTIRVRVTDSGGLSSIASTTVNVVNEAPSRINPNLSATVVNEGDTVTLTAQFIDPGTLDTHTVTVNWGDGSTATVINLGANILTFTAAHEYGDESPAGSPYVVTISIVDDDGGTGTYTAGGNLFTNGSFETGDYSGWTLSESPNRPVQGTWGVASTGQTINANASIFDFLSGINVIQTSSGLPRTFTAVDGSKLAFNLQSGPQDNLMRQEVPIPVGATTMTWNMGYENFATGFNPNDQFLSVRLLGLANNVLTTVFTTSVGFSDTMAMTPFTLNVAPFAGQIIQIEIQVNAQVSYLDAFFDNFNLTAPDLKVTVNNDPPELANVAITNGVLENGIVTLTGDIVDGGFLDAHELNINWGDGSALQIVSLPAGTTSFSVDHRYLDDLPNQSPIDAFGVTVTVKDDLVVSAPVTVTTFVSNVVPTMTNITITSMINENQIATITAIIFDPGTLDPLVLTINWGDGFSETLNLGPLTAPLNFTRTRQIPDDNPTGTPSDNHLVTFNLTDDDGGVAIHSTNVQVNNVPPVVTPIVGNVTGVRSRPQAYSTSFTDVGPLDTHQVRWDFGDGTVIPFHSTTDFLSLAPTHTYAAAGIYNITVTIRDDDTGTTMVSLTVEMSDVGLDNNPCDPGKKALFVYGTPLADKMVVYPNGIGNFVVQIKGTKRGDFDPNDFTDIFVYPENGNDKVKIDPRIRMNTHMDGGLGKDRLEGGAGDDVILGGDGLDQLFGGPEGYDVLIGGLGGDRIRGTDSRGRSIEDDSDLLIAGTTDYDDSEVLLCEIGEQWADRSVAYIDRVNNLLFGVGGITLDGTFVRRDSRQDQLYGGPGDDWHMLTLSQDIIIDIEDGEVKTGEG